MMSLAAQEQIQGELEFKKKKTSRLNIGHFKINSSMFTLLSWLQTFK